MQREETVKKVGPGFVQAGLAYHTPSLAPSGELWGAGGFDHVTLHLTRKWRNWQTRQT